MKDFGAPSDRSRFPNASAISCALRFAIKISRSASGWEDVVATPPAEIRSKFREPPKIPRSASLAVPRVGWIESNVISHRPEEGAPFLWTAARNGSGTAVRTSSRRLQSDPECTICVPGNHVTQKRSRHNHPLQRPTHHPIGDCVGCPANV